MITTEILGYKYDEEVDFSPIENIFTDDEKCNLFFTISHTINDTVLPDEEESNKYLELPQNRAPEVKKPKQNMGSEIPIKETDPMNKKPEQSGFLEDEEKPNVPNSSPKRSKRQA